MEDLGAERVAREAGALGERERLVEETERGGVARKLVAAETHAVEQVGPVDVRELGPLGELPRPLEDLETGADVAALDERPGLARERANLEVDRARREQRRLQVVVLLDRLVVALGVRQRLGAGQHRLDAAALVGGDATLEESRVDAQLPGEPLDRLARGPGLPALDLADVLLRETLAGEIGLRQPRGHAQLADALAEAGATGLGGGAKLAGCGHARGHRPAGEVKPILDSCASGHFGISPKKVIRSRKPGELGDLKIT